MADGPPVPGERRIDWLKQFKAVLLAVGFVFVVRTVVAEPYHVPSASMVPTLLNGDELIASKYAYGYSKYSPPIDLLPDFPGRLLGRPPQRGDVIVFRLPREPSTTYVKRLIGLPGDRIQVSGGRLSINGATAPRRLVGPFTGDIGRSGTATLYIETLPGGSEHEIIEMSDADRLDNTREYVVPPGHYFMMGDNRDNSVDSRIPENEGGVGFVPADNLVARADLVLLSRDPAVDLTHVAEWPHAFRMARLMGRIH
ncbi:signal peptidase I [Reyranella sp.]|uniref:signal peptidase I n=1 Tax=Reyranella sp. TaxID=1929291 RepID=UPI003BAB74BC